MLSLLFFSLIVFFDAVCDALENENFFESIFRNFNQKFWYKRVSWQFAKKIFNYKLDAWHISKSLKVGCIILSMQTYSEIIGFWQDLLIYGTVWIFLFWLFYNKIFRVK